MSERTIIEVIEDYKDCQRCEGKSCLGMVSNCSKPDSIVQVESELLRTLIADISLDRLEEICTAEKDGRCVVVPCKAGDTVYSLSCDEVSERRVIQLNIQFTDHIKHYSVITHNHRQACLCYENSDFGKTVFLTPEEAEAALAKEGDDERD